MKILAIETSCDDTASAVLETVSKDKIRVLSSVVSSQVKLHAPYGGVFPSLAAREHEKNLPRVLKIALQKSGLKNIAAIDLLAVTQGPGLAVALWKGINFAQTLAKRHQRPLIGVNHLVGHIFSNWLDKPTQICSLAPLFAKKIFPVLNLVVSGGHTQLVLMPRVNKFHLLGETLDDAAGECFDKTARLLELGYPGGPAIAAMAAKFKAKNAKFKVKLPRPVINSANYNFSFSGLKTAVLYLVKNLTAKQPLCSFRSAMAHEIQEAVVEVLTTKTIKAARQYAVKTIALSGGVSANKYLRQQLAKRIKQQLPGVKFLKPLMEYTTDNAAMIGLAGHISCLKNKTASEKKAVEAKANANFER